MLCVKRWGAGLIASVLTFGAVSAMSLIGTMVVATPVEAKVPGKTYCYKRVCHRVHTLSEMVRLVGRSEKLTSSHYDDCRRDRYNPCGLTSSGEKFRADAPDNAASPIYPNGTVLLLRNPKNGLSAVVRINNSGPYWGNRKLDVSRATAQGLGFRKQGVAKLEVRVVSVPTRKEARYKKNRRYDPVPGLIGRYASLDQAQGGVMVAMALDALSGSAFGPAAGKMLPAVKSSKRELAKLLRSGDIPLAGDFARKSKSVKVAVSIPSGLSPAEALRATARQLYGENAGQRRTAPSSVLASSIPLPIRKDLIPAILRSRQGVPRI